MTSLNPVMRVADQIVETFQAHGGARPEAPGRADPGGSLGRIALGRGSN